MSSTESAKTKPSWIMGFLDKLDEGVLASLPLGCGGLILAAGLTLLVQGYLYLKTGAWPHWALLTVGSEYIPNGLMAWLLNPQDWYGVHKIAALIFVECPIVLLTVGASITWLLIVIMMIKGIDVIREAVKS